MFHGRFNAAVSATAVQVPKLARRDGLGGRWDGCHAGSSPHSQVNQPTGRRTNWGGGTIG
jgi:hypothetical protein